MKSRAYATAVLLHALCAGPDPLPAVATLYLTLHTADPSAGDDQAGDELPGIVRVSVPRVPVPRVAGQWHVEAGAATNADAFLFAAIPRGLPPARVSHWSLGMKASGPGGIVLCGQFKEPQDVVAGMVLEIPPGQLRCVEF